MVDEAIRRVLGGDRDAFRVIVCEYQDMAYSIAMSVVKDELIARDVVQHAFVRAYNKLAQFRGDAAFSTWLYKILVNEAFRMLRQQGKDKMTCTDPLLDLVREYDPRDVVDDQQQRQYYVNEALMRMPPNESLALRLFYLEEKSLKEVSQITSWSVENTKVILYRARISMRMILHDYFKMEKQSFDL